MGIIKKYMNTGHAAMAKWGPDYLRVRYGDMEGFMQELRDEGYQELSNEKYE